MRHILFLAVLLLAPLAASAQPPAPQPPEMVLLPRTVVEAATAWIFNPTPVDAVRLFATLRACIGDNPTNGAIVRTGQDQCPEVTQAIADRDKQIADLTKQLAEAKAQAEKLTKQATDAKAPPAPEAPKP